MSPWRRRLSRLLTEIKESWNKFKSNRPQKFASHVKMCPSCGRLIAAKTQACDYCETSVGHIAVKSERGASKADSAPLAESVFAVFGVCVFFFTLGAILTSQQNEDGSVFDVLKSYFMPAGPVTELLGHAESFAVYALHEYWRLVTYMFLHGNLIHILFNLSALAVLGPLVLRQFGLRRFWLITFGTGIMGAVISSMAFFWHHATVGFSGALFGYLGALWINAKRQGDLIEADRWLRFMIFGNALMIGVSLLGMGIDNLCHLGGMFFGIFLGALMYESRSSVIAIRIEKVVLVLCLAVWGWGLIKVLPEAIFRAT